VTGNGAVDRIARERIGAVEGDIKAFGVTLRHVSDSTERIEQKLDRHMAEEREETERRFLKVADRLTAIDTTLLAQEAVREERTKIQDARQGALTRRFTILVAAIGVLAAAGDALLERLL